MDKDTGYALIVMGLASFFMIWLTFQYYIPQPLYMFVGIPLTFITVYSTLRYLSYTLGEKQSIRSVKNG